VTVLGVLGVLAVLLATALLATRGEPLLADAPPDRPDLPLPDRPMTADDVDAVRFSTAVRGYRMDEVDAVLARLADELAARDRRLAELTGPPAQWTPRDEPAE
jgi:DivIVA domain-containing protein